MLLRILRERLVRRRGRVLAAITAILIGAAVSSSFIDISLDISQKMSSELRSYGANILVEPKVQNFSLQFGGVDYTPVMERSYIDVEHLGRIKTIFWKHNIVGFTPYLYGTVDVAGQNAVMAGVWFDKEVEIPGARKTLPNGTLFENNRETIVTGVKTVEPWWQIRGEWVLDGSEGKAMLGESLARVLGIKIGDEIAVGSGGRKEMFRVQGIVTTGGFEDQQILVPLKEAQRILGTPKVADKVLVSALVKPDDEMARKPRDLMTAEEFEMWYCSPYIGAVTYQIEEVIEGSVAKPIRQISENEGKILGQMQLILFLTTIAALSASALGVASTMITTVFERR